MNKVMKKILIALALVLVAVISITKATSAATDPDKHEEIISQIDNEISTVLKLTAGAAGASAVVSLLPDDACTPIANELAEFSAYFLIVLSALYLEKYLVTVLGYASFSFLIPLACILWGFGYFVKKGTAKSVAYKLLICAIAIYLMIPVSARVSQLIYSNYETSIESTIEESNRISVSEAGDDAGLLEKFKTWISNAALTVSEYVTGLLSRFVDALAVMLVTSCLIPILVVLFFAWLIKALFNVQLPVENVTKIIKRKPSKEKEAEAAEA